MSFEIAPTAVMCFSSGNGGMERSAIRLAQLLSQITATTLMCKQASFIEDLYRQGEYAFDCETVKFSSRTFSPAMLVRVRSILGSRNFGNVIFFGASELKTLYFAFHGFDINLVVWHGTTKSRPKHDFFHRLVYSRVNTHVALSQHLVNNVRTIVPHADGVAFRVIYPSFRIDTNQTDAGRTEARQGLKLVHIGRVAAGKGQVDAVKACASLYDAGIDFQLDLVGPTGDTRYQKELDDAIDHAPYAGQVICRGFVDNPSEYLEQADILLFPSYGEGMPNAFIEALHYGLPCIAYHNTVFPEYLKMGFHVTLAADRDRQDLADKLLLVVKDLGNQKEASSINAKLARDYFDIRRELSSWREILK